MSDGTSETTLFVYKYDMEPPYFLEDKLENFFIGMKKAKEKAIEKWIDSEEANQLLPGFMVTNVEFSETGAELIQLTENLTGPSQYYIN